MPPEGLYSLCDDGLVARIASVVVAGALVCATFGCRKAPEAKRAIDAGLAACIPPDAKLIAGVDLDALRASPLYSKMPAAANAFAAQLGEVSSALVAYNGKELLVAIRGGFKAPPAGAATIAPGLAVVGSPEQFAAASAQYKSGQTRRRRSWRKRNRWRRERSCGSSRAATSACRSREMRQASCAFCARRRSSR